ncbi:MAG: hypothetical protein AYK18_12655 [Theionarchaea archaeon DG-70]|nr:MAG: hypothetical protein AYK18_12655 [Theionarchaea archaeon DG-70]
MRILHKGREIIRDAKNTVDNMREIERCRPAVGAVVTHIAHIAQIIQEIEMMVTGTGVHNADAHV